MERKHGLTLTELLVGVSIIGIIGVGIAAVAANMTQQSVVNLSTVSSRTQLQKAQAFISKDIQKAVAIYTQYEGTAFLPLYADDAVPVLALLRYRDGDLSTNAPDCLNASPFEFRAYYYLAPSTDLASLGFRGGTLSLYIDDCPDQPVPTALNNVANFSSAWWAVGGVPRVQDGIAADATLSIAAPLVDNLSNFTVVDDTVTPPAPNLSSNNASNNPPRVKLTLQGALNTALTNGQKQAQQPDLTATTVLSRRNF
ncbi:prepilin-type N-terminal cleavage/methylation domain-containing protein [Candidatus Cyanaurora vandensis]|uniref:prepilin-type N-terminal cleavage/methylation domain-containing protein n=1 Tax=Candidatus Cyanaurora vandensis TaxID=2714958 RepID=UPI00257E52B2|nr:prepilin-type N-terminal cleavage/methylation domain-containing protein [Candidatus Cyanaurora vandensis]